VRPSTIFRTILALSFALAAAPCRAQDYNRPRYRPSLWFESTPLAEPSALDLSLSDFRPGDLRDAVAARSLQAPISKFDRSFVVRIAAYFINDAPAGGMGNWRFKFHIILK